MKSTISILLSSCILLVSIMSQSHGQESITEVNLNRSYILNSQYQSGKTYKSEVNVELTMDIEMGKDAPSLTDKRIRKMSVTMASDTSGVENVPFKLTFEEFNESSLGELSEPELDIRMDTRIAGATGSISSGNLVVDNVCGIEPRYLDGMENVLKPVLELAYIHFPKEEMKVGDSFQNRYSVNFPVGGFGIVESTQDKVITLMSVENNIAKLKVETIVSGTFFFEGIAYPVTGGGVSLLTLDIENQYLTSFEKNHTDIITFNSGGTDITIRSTDISSNRTVISD